MAYCVDQEEVVFRKTLKYSFAFYLLLGIGLMVIRLPPLKPPDVDHLSERVAKLMLTPPVDVAPMPPPLPVQKEAKAKTKEAVPKEKQTPQAKVAEKPVEKEALARPSADQNRKIVQKSGLLASFVEEEAVGSLNAIMEDDRLEQALSQVAVVSARPTNEKNHTMARSMNLPHGSSMLGEKSKLADKTIANIGSLKKGEGVQLAEREAVTVAQITSQGGGVDGKGHGLGDGVALQVKGKGSGSAVIDYDVIAGVVEKYKGGLVYLYNKELRSNPTLKGTVTVEFSIDDEGKVVDARVSTSTMDHASLEEALAKRIKMWKFPKLYAGLIVVTYPFVFFPV